MGPKKEKKEKKEKPPAEESSTTATDAGEAKPEKKEKKKKDKAEKAPPTESETESAPEGKKDKKDKKGKKDKGPADPIVTDSINPFVGLPTAPPTAAPSEAISAVTAPSDLTEIKGRKGGSLEHGQGMPPTGGKPGWRRVSTRQWIRDFRDHIGKFQTYPYKPVCGAFFWSFGYYPDMVPQDSYQKYVAKHPISTRRHSTGSGGGETKTIGGTDTEISMSSTTDMSSVSKMNTDDNMNLPPLLPPLPDKKGKKGKGGDSEAPTDSEAEGKGSKKGKKDKKGKAEEATTESEAEGKGSKKDKKGKKGKEGAGPEDAAAIAAAAAAGGAVVGAAAAGKKDKKDKKDKKGKGGEAEGETTEASDAEAGGKKGKKGKKGAEIPVAAVSGNISFDPAVYDLTSLTVMNVPAGTDPKKLSKLFPGGKVTVDGAGATVKFKDVAAAQPFFTKDISLDGQGLVVSPKLKA